MCNDPAKRKRLGRSGAFMAQWFRRWTLESATRVRSPHGPLHMFNVSIYFPSSFSFLIGQGTMNVISYPSNLTMIGTTAYSKKWYVTNKEISDIIGNWGDVLIIWLEMVLWHWIKTTA